MNIKNIIGLIELFDVDDKDEMNPLKSMFLSKTGTVYDTYNGELTVRNRSIAKKIFGVTGQYVLNNIGDGVVRIPVNINGDNYIVLGLVDMDIVGEVLKNRLQI